MAKFAPIGPPHLLKRIRDEWGDEWLGDYHLVLAHDVVENHSQWRDNQILPQGSTVIVDNSIIELGKPVHPSVMQEACRILGSSYRKVLVLPDKFDDPEGTYDNALRWADLYRRVEDCEYMYAVQAKSMHDQMTELVMRDLYTLIGMGVTWVSAPRRIADKFGTRMFLLHSLLQCKILWPKLKIHLLGFSENVRDDLYCAQQDGVGGIDSTVPLRLGLRGEVLDLFHCGDQAGPRGTYWTDPHDKLTIRLEGNLAYLRDVLGKPKLNPIQHTPQLKEGLI